MKILKLNISNFGLLHNKRIELSEGLNLIYGENESGKSTIHSFIKGMLFGIDKSRGRPTFNDMYDKYQPWKTPGSYDGSLEFEVDKKSYHIYRNFEKNNKEMIVTNVDTGRKLELSQAEFQELLGGITKAAYDGTISIEQLKAKTDDDLVYELQNHITNLSMTKSEEIDVKKALDDLLEKRKEYDIKGLDEEIEELERKIKDGNQREEILEVKSSQLSKLVEQEEKLIKEKNELVKNDYYSINELNGLFIKFPVIKTKYGYYLDRQDQIEELKYKIVSTQKTLEINEEKNNEDVRSLRKSIESIEGYKEEYNQIDKERIKIKNSQEEAHRKNRRRNLNVMAPFLVIGLIIALINYNKNDFFFYMGVFTALTGIVMFLVLQLYEYKNKKDYQLENNKINQTLEVKKKNIIKELETHKVQVESELRNKYEDSLMQQATISQLKKELKENQDKHTLLEEKAKQLEQEILGYLKNFNYIYREDQKPRGKLSDEVIGILDEYITDENMKINHYEKIIKPELSDLKTKKEKLKWEIEVLEENEEELLENKGRYEELLVKKESYKAEIQSINLAIKTIKDLSIDIHDSFGRELNTLVSKLIKDITKGKYQELNVNEKLKIKTEIDDKYQHLERLSTGTIDQFYFSLRLAIADLIYKKGKVPILLDDSFVNYDDQRLRSTLEMLSGEGDRQILLFTCQKREKEILDGLGFDYNYIKL